MPTVRIPPLLRDLTGGQEQATVPGRSLRQVIRALDDMYPGMWDRLCDGEQVHPEIAVAVDGEVVGRALLERVEEDSEVHFIPAVRGG